MNDNESLFLKQPPRVLGLANAVRTLPTLELEDGSNDNLASVLRNTYSAQNSLIKMSTKNNQLVLQEIKSINKKLDKLVGLSVDEDRRARLRENREKQENSRMLKGLERMGKNISNNIKSKGASIGGGILDTLFPGLSRMLKGFGSSTSRLTGGLIGLLFGLPIAKTIGKGLIGGKALGFAKLGKGLFSGSTARLFKQNMSKSGIFGALFGAGRHGFAGARGAKEASNVIKSLQFADRSGRTASIAFKDVQKAIKATGGMGNMLKWMKNAGVVMTGTNGIKMLGSADPYKVFKDVMGAGAKGVKSGKNIAGFGKAAKAMFSKGGIGKVFSGVLKGGGKVAGKKVPILGAVLGTYLATQRWQEGDKLGAGLELLSGLLSTIPGYGTLGSLGIDALIFGRDILRNRGKGSGLWGGVKGLTKGGVGGAAGTLLAGAGGATLVQRLLEGGGLGHNLYKSSVFASLFPDKSGKMGALYDAFSGGTGVSLDKVITGGDTGTSTSISNTGVKKSTKNTENLQRYISRVRSRYPSGSKPYKDLDAEIKKAEKGKPVDMNMIRYYETAEKQYSSTNENSAYTRTGGVTAYNKKLSSLDVHTINGIDTYAMADLGLKGSLKNDNNDIYNVSTKNAQRLQELDKTLSDWGYKVTYTSAMGSKKHKGDASNPRSHYAGAKVDLNLYDRKTGERVKLTPEQLAYLQKKGYWGSGTGALGDEDSHYDFSIAGKAGLGARAVNFATDTASNLAVGIAPNLAGGLQEYTTKKKDFVDSVWATYKNMESGASSFGMSQSDIEAAKAGASIPASYLPTSLSPDKYNVTTQQALPSIDISTLLWWQLLMQM